MGRAIVVSCARGLDPVTAHVMRRGSCVGQVLLEPSRDRRNGAPLALDGHPKPRSCCRARRAATATVALVRNCASVALPGSVSR
jgi:hypothetical protein